MRLRSRGEFMVGGRRGGEMPAVSAPLGPATTSGKIWVPGPRWEALLAGAGWGQTAPQEHPLPLCVVSPSGDLWGLCLAGTQWPCPRAQVAVGKTFGTGLILEESRGGGTPQRKGSSDTALREAGPQRCPEKGSGSEKHPHPSPQPLPRTTGGSRRF